MDGDYASFFTLFCSLQTEFDDYLCFSFGKVKIMPNFLQSETMKYLQIYFEKKKFLIIFYQGIKKERDQRKFYPRHVQNVEQRNLANL